MTVIVKEAIVMDVDQVLLDYASRLREYVNIRDGKHITGHSESWDLTEWLQLDSREEMMSTITEFATSYEFGTLDAFPGADVILHSLMREGYALIALTACGTSDITTALRRVNMFHRFGDIFDEIHFVEFTDSKVKKLNDISSRYDIVAFVDDKPENIQDALYGSDVEKTILMKAPHNRKFREQPTTDVDFAFGWYECKHLINGYSEDAV